MQESKRQGDVIAILAIILMGVSGALGYFFYGSIVQQGPGFPLDDAYIHLVIGGNLLRWHLGFNPDEPAAASTSIPWSYLVGMMEKAFGGKVFIALVIFNGILLGLCGFLVISMIEPSSGRLVRFLGGLMTVLSWRLLWACGSGMETMLFTLAVILAVYIYQKYDNMILVGFTMGLCGIIRPEGLLVLGALVFTELIRHKLNKPQSNYKGFAKRIMTIASLFLIINLPVWLLNYLAGGHIFPNTMGAKLGTFTSHRIKFIFQLLLDLLPLGLITLPIVVLGLYTKLKERSQGWACILFSSIWIILHISAFFMFLPGTYQHLRYLMPILPAYIWLLFSGISYFSVRDTIKFGVIFLLLVFNFTTVINGALVYASNLRNVNELQVRAALWIDHHLPATEIIAADDIGALGYYTDNYILDLRGLLGQGVNATFDKPLQISAMLSQKNVSYLCIYPEFHTELLDMLPRKVLVATWQVENNSISAGKKLCMFSLE